jgi:hypothetical protein
MSEKPPNPHFGSSFDDWLKEQGIYEEVTTASLEKIKQMKAKGLTRATAADAPEIEPTPEQEADTLAAVDEARAFHADKRR